MSMFAPQQSGTSSIPKVGLHSFKAGKLSRVEGTKKIKPDSRKGLIYLQEVDELLHFYWKDRETGAVEDDLIIFPEDAEFVTVPESPSGRVFALKFNSSSQIMFYWMQEKDGKNDKDDVKRVNDLIADPKAAAPNGIASALNAGSLGGATAQDPYAGIDINIAARTMGVSTDQLRQILNMDDTQGVEGDVSMTGDGDDALGDISDQLPQDIQRERPSGEAPASAAQLAGIPHINDHTSVPDNSQLRTILSGIKVPDNAHNPMSEPMDLQDFLTPELVLPLLSHAEVRNVLFKHLPSNLLSDPPTLPEVSEIMNSVQWRQALMNLSQALNSNQDAGSGSVIRSLGIPVNTLEPRDGVEAFIRAIAKMLQESSDGDAVMEE